jgi:DNA-binding MarR family transcriptional regulator
MVGRGFRLNEGKENCLVLDYAGNIERFGPVDQVKTPLEYFSDSKGDTPIKMCPQCTELLQASCGKCDNCGYQFPKKSPHDIRATELDILSIEDPEDAEALMMFPQLGGNRGKNLRKVALYIAKECRANFGYINFIMRETAKKFNMPPMTLSGILRKLSKLGVIDGYIQKGCRGNACWISNNRPSFHKLLKLSPRELGSLLAIVQLLKRGHVCTECKNDYATTIVTKVTIHSKYLMSLEKKGLVFIHRNGRGGNLWFGKLISISNDTREQALKLLGDRPNLIFPNIFCDIESSERAKEIKRANLVREKYSQGHDIKSIMGELSMSRKEVWSAIKSKRQPPEQQPCTI